MRVAFTRGALSALGAAIFTCVAASTAIASSATFKLPPNSCFVPLVDTRINQLGDNASALNDYFRGLGVTSLESEIRQSQAATGSVWKEAPVDALRAIVEAKPANCKDLIIYIAGHGPREPEKATEGQVQLGTLGAQKGEEGNTSIDASDLRYVIARHPAVTFKLIIESCDSGIFLDSANPNWVSSQTSAVKAGKPSAPSLSNPPANLLEVTVSATRDEACRNSGKFVSSLIGAMKKAETQVATSNASDQAALLIHTGFVNSGWVNQGVFSNGTKPPEQYNAPGATGAGNNPPTSPPTTSTPTGSSTTKATGSGQVVREPGENLGVYTFTITFDTPFRAFRIVLPSDYELGSGGAANHDSVSRLGGVCSVYLNTITCLANGSASWPAGDQVSVTGVQTIHSSTQGSNFAPLPAHAVVQLYLLMPVNAGPFTLTSP